MPQTPHIERHFTAGETIRDIVIGISDGLTVPFALAAGLSGRFGSSALIVVAGMAEIVAGAIAMGLGGYLAARSDAEHYASERAREQSEVHEIPAEETTEVAAVLSSYGISHEKSIAIVEDLRKHPDRWVDFMMRFELGLEKPDPRRAPVSALTIAIAYVAGGMIPLSPYIALANAREALTFSAAMTLTALAVFGYVKGRFTGAPPLRSAGQTTLIGGLAAGAAFMLARAIS